MNMKTADPDMRDRDGIEAIDDDLYDVDQRSDVECICPKCGKKHVVQFHWIGQGVPRKYCRKCRLALKDSA